MCTQQEIEEKMIKQQNKFTAGVREEEVAWGESKVERGVWDFRKGEKEKMKYDKIVAISQEKSKVKAEIAKQEIQNMLDKKRKSDNGCTDKKKQDFLKTLFLQKYRS